tara:strand:- start:2895 stop:3614 length:720 start_codon:yes stop_codon:yes gene_type:complete
MDQPLRLKNCHEALLNQFLHFDPMHLVVRSRGLSFVRETNFGVFTSKRGRSSRMIRDGESGLVLCPERLESVYLFSPGANRPPAFEFDFADYGFGISIQPRETPRNLEILARIASLFGDAVVPASDLIARGAGSWLDEWGHLEQSASEGSTDARVSGTAAEGKIAAQIVTPGFEAEIAMRPAFEDRDGQIRRIAAAGGCDAIVIDADVLVIGDSRVDQWDGRQLLKRRAEQLRSEVTTR